MKTLFPYMPTSLSVAYILMSSSTITSHEIITFVEKYFKLKPGELKTKTHKHSISHPRIIAIWLVINNNLSVYEKPLWSKTSRDHFLPALKRAAMINNYKNFEKNIAHDTKLHPLITDIQKKLNEKYKTIADIKTQNS